MIVINGVYFYFADREIKDAQRRCKRLTNRDERQHYLNKYKRDGPILTATSTQHYDVFIGKNRIAALYGYPGNDYDRIMKGARLCYLSTKNDCWHILYDSLESFHKVYTLVPKV